MPTATFEIRSSVEFYRALKEAEEDYQKEPTSSRKAITAFLFAYHLREWIWKEHSAKLERMLSLKDESAFNKYVNGRCIQFKIVREICNGSKHFRKELENIVSSGFTGGDFSRADFDCGHLTVTTEDGDLSVSDILSQSVALYEELLKEVDII